MTSQPSLALLPLKLVPHAPALRACEQATSPLSKRCLAARAHQACLSRGAKEGGSVHSVAVDAAPESVELGNGSLASVRVEALTRGQVDLALLVIGAGGADQGGGEHGSASHCLTSNSLVSQVQISNTTCDSIGEAHVGLRFS